MSEIGPDGVIPGRVVCSINAGAARAAVSGESASRRRCECGSWMGSQDAQVDTEAAPVGEQPR